MFGEQIRVLLHDWNMDLMYKVHELLIYGIYIVWLKLKLLDIIIVYIFGFATTRISSKKENVLAFKLKASLPICKKPFEEDKWLPIYKIKITPII